MMKQFFFLLFLFPCLAVAQDSVTVPFDEDNVHLPGSNLWVGGTLEVDGATTLASGLTVTGTVDATAFTGDGSRLTGTGDSLGTHVAAQNLIMGGNWVSGDGGNEGLLIDGDGNVRVSGSLRIGIDSAPAAPSLGDLYVTDGNLYFYNGTVWEDLTLAASGGDSLGDHVATQALDMAGQVIKSASGLSFDVNADGVNDIEVPAPGRVSILGLPQFSNNRSALRAGLKPGDLYRRGTNPDYLCIVTEGVE